MALTALGGLIPVLGDPFSHYEFLQANATTPHDNTDVIDATGEMIAIVGRVYIKGGGTKNIRKIGTRLGTCVSAGGSGWTISLQDVDTAAGPPARPDGTQDQTVALAAAAVGTGNAWISSNAFSADRSVTHGDWVSVVFEYDGSGRQGADAFRLSTIRNPSGTVVPMPGTANYVMKLGGSWAADSNTGRAAANIRLEFSDGTYGTLMGGAPFSATTYVSFNSTSTQEYGLKFQVPVELEIDGLNIWLAPENGAGTFDVILYTGTTATLTISDFQTRLNWTTAPAGGRQYIPIAPTTLAAATDYHLIVKPTNGGLVRIAHLDVNSTTDWQAYPMDSTWQFASRTGGSGAFSYTTTRRPFGFGFNVSKIHAAGGGGGLAANPLLGFVR